MEDADHRSRLQSWLCRLQSSRDRQTPAPEQALIEREQWRSLLGNLPWAVGGNSGCAVLLAAVVWLRSGEPAAIVWLCAVLLLSLWRVRVLRRHGRVAASRGCNAAARRRVLAGSFLGGLSWGLGSALLMPSGDLPMQLFFCLFAVGLIASAVVSLTPVFASFALFELAYLPILAGGFIWELAPTQVATGLAALLFCGVMYGVARNVHRQTTEGLVLRFANARLIRDLSAARDAAEAANHAKGEFLAAMSHDLRTPLNAILGFSELIRDERFGQVGVPAYREYAQDIHASGRYLLGLINDILDYSKFESGEMRLQAEPVDLAELVEACLAMVEVRARRQGLAVESGLPPDLPLVEADANKLRQVLLNLLTNAVKFTQRGGRIAVHIERDDEGGVRIVVSDTGVGMSEQEVGVALQPFRQVHQCLAGEQEGTGLGLPLAKNLVELHGGRLTVESLPGRGTTVVVELPPHLVIEQRRPARRRRVAGTPA